jgi:hypothetical protein
MYFSTKAMSASGTSKSGKPWDRLQALQLLANWVMTVKMVVPMSGNLDVNGFMRVFSPIAVSKGAKGEKPTFYEMTVQ